MHCNSGCGSGCATAPPCPCPTHGNPAIDSLEKLVNCYWENHQQLAVEQSWYGSLESRADAVHEAALALADENVDLDHVPDRIPLGVLARAKERLLAAVPALEQVADFDTLLARVSEALHGLEGIHDALIFSTALRIGMQAGFEPQRIYLHDEVRDGAAQLVELAGADAALERAALPRIFHHPDLPAAVIQGCLAVCRHQLQWLRRCGQLA